VSISAALTHPSASRNLCQNQIICNLTVLDDPTGADDRHGDPAGVVPRHQLELTVADGHDVGGR